MVEKTARLPKKQAAPETLTSAVQELVKILGPWKELITILLIFGGGFVWVLGYFATKQQVTELKCYARESVALARAETALKISFDELVQKTVQIEKLESRSRDPSFTESDRLDLKRFQREFKDLEERRKASQARFERAEKSLTDGVCPKED
jgi:hypothetical protein